jgi:hypothetical protein
MRYAAWIPIALTLAGCARADRTQVQDPTHLAAEIQRGAQNAVGGAAAVRNWNSIRAEAQVEGPESEFVTTVWSARDGRARMQQSDGPVLASHPDGDWQLEPATGSVKPLGAELLAFLRGHELHAAVLAPASRYLGAAFDGEVTFADQRALAVSMADSLGNSVVAYFAATDSLPLGFRMMEPDPDVVVMLSEWQSFGELRLFTRALFTQGQEEFRYTYTDIRCNDVPDSVFALTPAERNPH